MSEKPKEKAAKKLPTPVRWTVQAGSLDFAVDEKTLAARLNRAGTLPGRDKKYSTAQICAAVYGDHKLALIRGQEMENEIKATELAKLRNEAISVEWAFQVASNTCFAIKRIIEMSKLANAEKDSIYAEINGLSEKDFKA